MKKILLIPFMLSATLSFGQRIDTVLSIKNGHSGKPLFDTAVTIASNYLITPTTTSLSFDSSRVVTSVSINGTGDSIYIFKGEVKVGVIKLGTGGGGSGTPAGSNGYAQFNNGGSFGGDSSFFWDNTNKRLGIGTTTPTLKLGIVVPSGGTAVMRSTDSTGYAEFRMLNSSNDAVSHSANFGYTGKNYLSSGIGIPGEFGYFGTNGAYPFTLYTNNFARLTVLGGGNVGIGTISPDTTSVLDLSSTTKGLLSPRMTTTQKNAIASPREGLEVYDLSLHQKFFYNGTSWVNGSAGGSNGYVQFNNSGGFGGSSNLFWDNTNNRLGIGTTTPTQSLDISNAGTSASQATVSINSGTAAISGTYYAQGGTVKALFGLSGGTNSLITGSAAGDFNIRNAQRILFSTDAGSTAAGNINASGNWFIGGITSATEKVQINGNLSLATAGNKIKITTGTNASVGTATLVAGTVTVSTSAALAGSLIYVTVKSPSGTQGFLSVPTITNATSFVINSTSATETSTVNWWIIN